MSKSQNKAVRGLIAKVPLSDIYFDNEALEAVSRVLTSKRYILGEETASFEEEFAKKVGTRYAVAVSSGTAALFLSMLACEIGKGDEVIVPSFSFIASASIIIDAGATPIFCDVDSETLTADPIDIEKKITPRTKAILPVHLFGHPAAMSAITEIAERHSLQIIEDCAQAHGSTYKGKKVGSFGIASCFSFYPSKNLTVYGDGGMVTTNDSKVADDIKKLRNHGRTEKYVHERLGYNFRLSEIAAALGRYQLRQLDSFNEARRKSAGSYDDKLGGYVTTPVEKVNASHVYHMYVVRTLERDKLKDFLESKGVETGVHYPIPIHLQPAIKAIRPISKLPVTERECGHVLSLPMFPTISEDTIRYVTDSIKEFLSLNRREIGVRSSAPLAN